MNKRHRRQFRLNWKMKKKNAIPSAIHVICQTHTTLYLILIKMYFNVVHSFTFSELKWKRDTVLVLVLMANNSLPVSILNAIKLSEIIFYDIDCWLSLACTHGASIDVSSNGNVVCVPALFFLFTLIYFMNTRNFNQQRVDSRNSWKYLIYKNARKK